MKVLYLDWDAFGKIDYPFTFEHELGIEVAYFNHQDYLTTESEDFLLLFKRYVEELHCDFAFSINYFVMMAEGAKRCGIPYVCVVYDSPQYFLYHKSAVYPTNHVYHFDSQEALRLNAYGINTVKYTVLPVNSTVIDTMLRQPYDAERTTCEVSFVGQMYDEEPNYFKRMMDKLDDRSRGFVQGLMAAQMQVYGADVVTPSITKELLAKMMAADRYSVAEGTTVDPREVYADDYICKGITSVERRGFLQEIAKKHDVKLFTVNPKVEIARVKNMGGTNYYDEMPLVFHNSKINLNITLRSIKNGIPLRAMDIIGAGGFLLTNFQSDFLNHFYPDEEFVYFEDREDLLKKVDYYLEHEDKRIAIAKAGHERAKAEYNFRLILKGILEESVN
ncbi:MAG: glycosyltransferase [Pseudobutyrivibrio sp.]|nr:glycosyltransferase [Pseudobutyrivibrio sp.]